MLVESSDHGLEMNTSPQKRPSISFQNRPINKQCTALENARLRLNVSNLWESPIIGLTVFAVWFASVGTGGSEVLG